MGGGGPEASCLLGLEVGALSRHAIPAQNIAHRLTGANRAAGCLQMAQEGSEAEHTIANAQHCNSQSCTFKTVHCHQ